MPRVCHLIANLEMHGAQRALLSLLHRTDRQRFPSRVISLVGGGRAHEAIEAEGVEVSSLGMRAGRPTATALVRLARELRDDPPDILQTWMYHADLLGALSRRRAKRAHLVWNVRCSDHEDRTRKPLRELVMRACARLSGWPDAIVVNSQAGRRFHTELGYRPRRWEHIPNGFDLERFRPAADARPCIRRELGVRNGRLLAGVFARFDPTKGHADLLEAIARVRDGPAHFLVAGQGATSGNAELVGLAHRLGVADRVTWLGERSDVERLMAGIDFLISPSRHEGFPNAVGEGMACGTPCVATAAGDTAELVGDGGFVVPPAQPQALADAIARMTALSPEERADLGGRARERIRERYDLRSITSRYEVLYTSLMEAVPSGAAPAARRRSGRHR